MLAKTACFAALVASASAFSAGPALPLRQTQVCIPCLCSRPLFTPNAATAQVFWALSRVLSGSRQPKTPRQRRLDARREPAVLKRKAMRNVERGRR